MIKLLQLVFVLMLGSTVLTHAQTTGPSQADKAAQYTEVITKRADKIVAKLNITDQAKYKRVLDVIVNQYRSINDIHDARNTQAADIKKQAGDDKADANTKIKVLDDDLDQKINKQHTEYLSKLSADLSADQ